MRFDAFELDELEARLHRDGALVHMPPRAFAVLCTLARQSGHLVTKDELLDAVWGHRHVSESVLKTTISELRAALTDDARQPRYIETASRRGYRFIAKVAEVQLASELQGPGKFAFGNAQRGMGTVPFDYTSQGQVDGGGARLTMGTVPIIGRESALAELHAAWERAQQGDRQLVWIAGEAGVGKTRLIERFVQDIGAEVVTVGQCIEDFGTGEPYLPILEATKELCRRDPALVAGMRAVAPTWLVQMPWLLNEAERAKLYKDVEGAHQDRMVREMRELMDRFTAKRPLVFVLEDLHWADAGTLRMMEHFARRPREVRILWIASFRLTQVLASDHPLRALRQELKLHNLCREIVLDPFTEREVASYLGDRMPAVPLSEDFVRRIHEHTDGLPLFVANVADSLLARK
jgi:DNA-binding winged helix-turn-helix (wHTH) protein